MRVVFLAKLQVSFHVGVLVCKSGLRREASAEAPFPTVYLELYLYLFLNVRMHIMLSYHAFRLRIDNVRDLPGTHIQFLKKINGLSQFGLVYY